MKHHAESCRRAFKIKLKGLDLVRPWLLQGEPAGMYRDGTAGESAVPADSGEERRWTDPSP